MANTQRELEFILRFKTEAEAALRAAGIDLGKLGDEAGKAARTLKESADGLDKNTKASQSFIASTGEIITALGSLAAGFYGVKSAVDTFGDVEQGLLNVKTLVPENTALIDSYKQKLEELSITSGQSFGILSDGLYQTVSAFGEVDNAFDIFKIANETAVAGAATTQESLSLLAASMKGYGDRTTEFAHTISNLAFIAVALGEATIPQMANALGSVVPIAKAAGLSIQEVYASMALVGTTGPSAAEVATQLRATLVGLERPTKEMTAALNKLGIQGFKETRDHIEKAGLQNFLKELAHVAEESGGHITELFTRVEAWGFILALTETNAKDFSDAVKQMFAEGGEQGERAKAFAIQMDGLNRSISRAGAVFEVLKSRFGEVLSGPIKAVAGGIATLGVLFLQLDPTMQKVIAATLGVGATFLTLTPILALLIKNADVLKAGFAAIFAPARIALQAFLHPVATLQAGFVALRTAALALSGVLLSWPVMIAAVIALFLYFDDIMAALGLDQTEWGKTMIKMWFDLHETIRQFVNRSLGWLDFFASGLGVFAVAVGELFGNLIGAIGDLMISLGGAAWLALQGDTEGAMDLLKNSLERGLEGITGVGGKFNQRLMDELNRTQNTDYVGELGTLASNIWDGLAGAVEKSGAVQNVKDAITRAAKTAGNFPTLEELLAGAEPGGALSEDEKKRVDNLKESFQQATRELEAQAVSHHLMAEAYQTSREAVEQELIASEAFQAATQAGAIVTRDATGAIKGKTAADQAAADALLILTERVKNAAKKEETAKHIREYNDDIKQQIGLLNQLVGATEAGNEGYKQANYRVEALKQLTKEYTDVIVTQEGAVLNLKAADGKLTEDQEKRLRELERLIGQHDRLAESVEHLDNLYRKGAPVTFFEGLKKGFEDLQEGVGTVGELTQHLFSDTITSGVDAVAEALTSNTDSFKEWSSNIIGEIGKVIAKWLLMKAILAGLNAVFDAFGSSSTKTAADPTTSGSWGGVDGETYIPPSQTGFPKSASSVFRDPNAAALRVDIGDTGFIGEQSAPRVQVIHNNYAQGVVTETNQKKGPSGEDVIEIVTRQVSSKMIEKGSLDTEFRRRGIRMQGVHR